ncbi:hypothetical protein P692DRAFT_20583026 [Suillus brevipes Sb2]|nr:hypothetical protein P692DRAFT_20583026 [Suillus brevipes Sb2]
MAHIFTRDLTFQSNDLEKDTTLVLTFDADMNGLYNEFFPVVWQAFTFGRHGSYRARATYTNQFAFFTPKVSAIGNITDASACVELNVGEKTSLTEANQVYHFSNPVAGVEGALQAANNTDASQSIAIGFMSRGNSKPEPALYFPEVRDGKHATVQFNPVLRAYIASDYQETAILRGPLDDRVLWSQDIAALSDSTTWNLTRDPSTGRYSIVQA